MAALASIAALALAQHAPRDAPTRPPSNPRATNHPGVRRRDALLAVGTLCVATDREPSRAAEPERPTRPTACVAGTSCVSTASFRSPANYLPPWEYVGDDATAFKTLVDALRSDPKVFDTIDDETAGYVAASVSYTHLTLPTTPYV